MLATILNNSKVLSLENYERIINLVINSKDIVEYDEKMHPYILHNNQLDNFIQTGISINKKFFNAIQKSSISSIHLITEAWCLDASIILPLLRSIQIIKPEIDIKVYQRDKNEDLMNLYLTNGSKSIPIVFAINESQEEIFRWGPRSQKAKSIIDPLKDKPYDIKSKALREFYEDDRNKEIQLEWIDLLK